MRTTRSTGAAVRTTVATLMALALVSACSKTDNGTRTDSAAGNAAANPAGTSPSTPARDTGVKRDSTAAANNATNNGTWTPAAVLGFATAANNGEIKEGQLAEKKATNPQVKAFARQIVADHEAMLSSGKTYASGHNVTPDTANGPGHDLMNDAKNELDDLNKKAAGADWDKNFLDKEIDGHKKVLDKLQDASKNTTDADLKAMLEKATGKVQEHLTKAQDLRAKMK